MIVLELYLIGTEIFLLKKFFKKKKKKKLYLYFIFTDIFDKKKKRFKRFINNTLIFTIKIFKTFQIKYVMMIIFDLYY